ncbi:hypothetical protein HDV64DRAFT_99090 [Trichoderma sp. TUCIM 5745]
MGVSLLWVSRACAARLGLRSQHCSYHSLTRAGLSSNHGVAVCTCQEHLAYSVTLQPVWVVSTMYQDCTFRQRVCTPSRSPRLLFHTASPTEYPHSTSALHFVCIDPLPRLLHLLSLLLSLLKCMKWATRGHPPPPCCCCCCYYFSFSFSHSPSLG